MEKLISCLLLFTICETITTTYREIVEFIFPILYNVTAERGGIGLKIEIKIDESCTEPKIVIVTDRVTDKINEIIKKLSVEPSEVLAGFRDEKVTVLEPNEIDRIYASGGKVYAETKNDAFLLRLRLYEAEQRLASASFVRISNSEIINLKKVRGFDLSFTGTICVSLSNGTVTYVSRRYVAKIKQLLGL